MKDTSLFMYSSAPFYCFTQRNLFQNGIIGWSKQLYNPKLFDKKASAIFDCVNGTLEKITVARTFGVKLLIKRLPSFSVPKTRYSEMCTRLNVAENMTDLTSFVENNSFPSLT